MMKISIQLLLFDLMLVRCHCVHIDYKYIIYNYSITIIIIIRLIVIVVVLVVMHSGQDFECGHLIMNNKAVNIYILIVFVF